MQAARTQRATVFVGEILALIYMGAVAFSARKTGFSLLLFPELTALSHDVFTRPRGKWASQPWRLVLTPTITALFGIFVVRNTNFNPLALTLIVGVSLLVIKLLKSTIAPAISAGVLPMVLAERSWIYPVDIFAGLSLLALVLLVWKQHIPTKYVPSTEEEMDSKIVDDLEALPRNRFWGAALLVFVFALATISKATGLFFLIFPPLIVVAYEILGHPEVPGWMERPILFPLISVLAAAVGLRFCHIFAAGVVGVIVTMLCLIAIVKIFKIHMPPTLTVGILPFVMKAPNCLYPMSVLLGTIALMLYFRGYIRLRESAWLKRLHYAPCPDMLCLHRRSTDRRG